VTPWVGGGSPFSLPLARLAAHSPMPISSERGTCKTAKTGIQDQNLGVYKAANLGGYKTARLLANMKQP
jgi:hypothetical protein